MLVICFFYLAALASLKYISLRLENLVHRYCTNILWNAFSDNGFWWRQSLVTQGQNLEVLVFDVDSEYMKNWLIVCSMKTWYGIMENKQRILWEACQIIHWCLIVDFLLTQISGLLFGSLMLMSQFRYLRHKIFNEFVRLSCYCHESCSFCYYP